MTTLSKIAALLFGLWLLLLSVAFAQPAPSTSTSAPQPAPSSASPAPPPASQGAVVALELLGGGGGPLELKPKEGGLSGELVIVNRGSEPLTVSRVAIRGDDDDVRAPPRMSARLVEGGLGATTIPPGGSRRVLVQWLPDREPRLKQSFSHVVVTTSDERAGEVAMGVVGRLPRPLPWLTDHLLSYLVLLPALGALVLWALQFARRTDDRAVRGVALVAVLAQCALAAFAFAGFNPDATRIDGNDGLQLIEHVVWIRAIHAEYFVGVDGLNIVLVVLVPLLSACAVIGAWGGDRPRGFFAMLLLLDASLVGALVAQDLLLLFCFLQLAILTMAFVIGLWGREDRARAAIKLALVLFAGSAAMLLAIVALYHHGDRTFLVDGTATTATFSIPDLSRVAFHAKKLELLGFPFAKIVWLAFFVAFATLTPIFPLHAWLADALECAPPPASALIAGGAMKLGIYGLLRVCYPILPEATRWAAGALVAFGVTNLVYAALCAMGQRDLKRLLAYAAMAHAGMCLVGAGSLTPQGIAASIYHAFAQGLAIAVLFLSAGALEHRAGVRDVTRFGGLSSEVPFFSTIFGVGILASMGLPGLSGFWGELLAIMGAFPNNRVLGIVAAAGVVLAAAYHLWTMQRMLFGRLDEAWRRSARLEPFGGKFPDLTARELASVAPLALLLLVLGLAPAAVLGAISGAVRDTTHFVNPPGPDQVAQTDEAAAETLALAR